MSTVEGFWTLDWARVPRADLVDALHALERRASDEFERRNFSIVRAEISAALCRGEGEPSAEGCDELLRAAGRAKELRERLERSIQVAKDAAAAARAREEKPQ